MLMSDALTPFVAWLLAGSLKFMINSVRARRLAFDLIGYGGLPSNHSSIVFSALGIVALRSQGQSPALVIGIALAFIVLLDAHSLRRNIGKQAEAINRLSRQLAEQSRPALRERIGHSAMELACGALTGLGAACLMYWGLPALCGLLV